MKNQVESILLKNVQVWNGNSFEFKSSFGVGKSGVYISDDKLANYTFEKELDANNALVIPAFFALGLDFMEPHRDDVYTFKDGAKAMRQGGFYGGLYESKANPIDDSEKLSAAIERKNSISKEHPLAIHFLGSYSVGFGSSQLSEMLELSEGFEASDGVAGFGDGSIPYPSVRFLRLAMEYGSMTGKRFFFQPNESSLLSHGIVHEGAYADMLGMKGIPRISETIAVYTILELSRFLKTPVHFKQITCGESLNLIRDARKKGIDVTCDVGIYHLLFDDSSLEPLRSNFHIIPPLRAKKDREALIEGLLDGTVDAISMNHKPVLREDKEVNFEDSVPGALSLEVAVEALWNFLSEKLGAKKTIELLSVNPAKLAGAKPIAYALDKESDINFILLDKNKEHKITRDFFAGHVSNSPLLFQTLPSTLIGTYIGGLWTSVN